VPGVSTPGYFGGVGVDFDDEELDGADAGEAAERAGGGFEISGFEI